MSQASGGSSAKPCCFMKFVTARLGMALSSGSPAGPQRPRAFSIASRSSFDSGATLLGK
jgi:hypothetical protein